MRFAIEIEAIPNFGGDVNHRLRALLKYALRAQGFKCRTAKPLEQLPPKRSSDPGDQPATDGYFPRVLLNGKPDDGIAF